MTTAETRTLGFGIAGSLAVHVLIFCVLAIWITLQPARKILEPTPEPEPAVTMVLAQSIVEEPEPVMPKPEPEVKNYIRTTQNETAPMAPANAKFISDRSTTAAAKLPEEADGKRPVPTTHGIKVPTMELANREYQDGKLKNDSAPVPPAAPPAPMPKMKEPQMAKKEDSPAEKMMKETDEKLADAKQKVDDAKLSKNEGAEHLPLEVRKPGEQADQLPAMKAPVEETLPKPLPVTAPPAPPAPPIPHPEKEAFVPQTRTSEVKGTLTSRGNSDSVDAAMTLEGRYTRDVYDAVSMRWHRYVREKIDLVKPGSIFTVHFFVNEDGTVNLKDMSVIPRDFSDPIASIAIASIRDAKIPAIPRELRGSLDRGRFSIGINFLIGQ